MRASIPLIVLAAAALSSGCGASDPDGELRNLIDAAESAAEERDVSFFRDLIADSYVDRRGQRRDDVINTLRGYFLINSSVEVANRIESIELSGQDAAKIVLQTALIGRAQGRALLGIDGDLYRIELELVKDGGDWQIIGADWDRMLR